MNLEDFPLEILRIIFDENDWAIEDRAVLPFVSRRYSADNITKGIIKKYP
jgi:hypothetical protein